MEVERSRSLVQPPNIKDFYNYRSYLEAFFNYKKASRSFSYRQFSAMVGLKSPNYLQLVIQGKRNLTETTALRIAEKMKLSTKEAHYFVSMVRLENALNDEDKMRAEKERHVAFKKLVTSEVHDSQILVLEEWWHLLVRETLALKDFEPSGEWISKRLRGIISPNEAERSLHVLLKAGFISNTNGKWILTEPVLDTGLTTFPHAQMQKVHSDLLKCWAKNLSRFSAKDQELGVLNIPIKKSSIPELQKKILQFQDEIIGWLQNETVDGAEEIVQLGTYLISYSK